MRMWSWVKDHRTQSLIGLVALLVGILALARDVIGFQFLDPRGDREPGLAATAGPPSPEPSAAVVRRGPQDLRMIGGSVNVVETEVDLDSLSPNWQVNSCAENCDINFRGSLHGVEEAYGQMARSPADRGSCRSATAYGHALTPREAKIGAEVCVLTNEGRFAGLVVKDVRKSDSDHVESILFEVTVWEV